MAKVTDVRIRKGYEEDSKVKAIVSVTLDNAYVIHGIKVIDGVEGYFVAMPAKKLREGEYKDIFHPVSQEARQTLQREILGLYELEIKKDANITDEE